MLRFALSGPNPFPSHQTRGRRATMGIRFLRGSPPVVWPEPQALRQGGRLHPSHQPSAGLRPRRGAPCWGQHNNSREPPPPFPSALPDVTFRHCPLHETTHRMADLEELVAEDMAAGLLPIMVHSVVGMSPYSFSDDLPSLQRLCSQHGMMLSLDGPGVCVRPGI
jgi:hypothetical protein